MSETRFRWWEPSSIRPKAAGKGYIIKKGYILITFIPRCNRHFFSTTSKLSTLMASMAFHGFWSICIERCRFSEMYFLKNKNNLKTAVKPIIMCYLSPTRSKHIFMIYLDLSSLTFEAQIIRIDLFFRCCYYCSFSRWNIFPAVISGKM